MHCFASFESTATCIFQAVLDNPTCFTNPFQFEITFECLQELDDDLEWKVLYVGSAQDAAKDQILDEILVGPVPVGVNKFVLQADAPDPSQLAQDDLLGVTVVLVTCSYKEREFVRVGYYVNNEYHDPNAPLPVPPTAAPAVGPDGTPVETTPAPPQIPNPVPLEHIQRQILADKPRVTKFPISWGDEQPAASATTAGEGAAASATSTGAAMMADRASAMMTGVAPMNPPATVTPSGTGGNDDMEEEDIMDDEELSVDEEGAEAGELSTSGDGIVSMPEESNMSHVYFANSASNSNGVQAMAE